VSPPAAPSIRRLWAALLVVYVVWGSTYLAIRVVVTHGLPPLLSGGARFVTAGAVLAGVVAVRRGPAALRVSWRQLGAAALVGTLLLLGGNGLVSIGEQTVPSGLAALLIAATPLWMVVLRAALGIRAHPLTVAGVLVGFVGLTVLARPGGGTGGASAAGVAVIAVAPLLWAAGSVLSPRLPLPPEPFVASAWEMLTGGAIMLVAAVARGEARGFRLDGVESAGWLGLGYLVMFGSLVAFSAYVWLLANAPIPLVSTYAYVNPVVAVTLGALLLAEPVTPAVVGGGTVTVLGVLLVVRSERPGTARGGGDPAEAG
jgi:drug/metabolite transporter (DMT)-like permease